MSREARGRVVRGRTLRLTVASFTSEYARWSLRCWSALLSFDIFDLLLGVEAAEAVDDHRALEGEAERILSFVSADVTAFLVRRVLLKDSTEHQFQQEWR